MKRVGSMMLFAAVASVALAQQVKVSGEVSDKMKERLADQTIYLVDMATKAKLDSCKLEGNNYQLHTSVGDKAKLLVVNRLNVMLVGEAGEVKISADGVTSGTPQNDVWGKHQAGMNKLEEDIDQQYEAATKDPTLDKSQKAKLQESLMDEYASKCEGYTIGVMRANPDNQVNTLAAYTFASGFSCMPESYDRVMELANAATRQFAPMAKIGQRMEVLRKTAVGKMFTDFVVPTGNADGTQAKLSDYVGKGKYILVDFWASWCGPCRREIPNIKKVYERYHGDKFDVLSVATWDKRKDTERALKQENLPWPQMFDCDKIPSETYGFNGIPQIMLFAPDGTIVAKDLRGDVIMELVGESLAK